MYQDVLESLGFMNCHLDMLTRSNKDTEWQMIPFHSISDPSRDGESSMELELDGLLMIVESGISLSLSASNIISYQRRQ